MIRISLGSDCSVAYNLQRLGYRVYSFPLDWLLSKNITNVLREDFKDFCNPKYLKFCNRVNCCNISENFTEDTHNMIRVIHTKYKLHFLHDFIEKEINEEVEEKYERRIQRFYNIMRDKNIEKRLYRISKYDERDEIEKIFNEKKFVNWKLHIKLYSEIPVSEDWKRTNFNWEFFLT